MKELTFLELKLEKETGHKLSEKNMVVISCDSDSFELSQATCNKTVKVFIGLGYRVLK